MALLAFSHCLTTGRLGGQAFLLSPTRLAFGCFYPPHARLCAPLPLPWITQGPHIKHPCAQLGWLERKAGPFREEISMDHDIRGGIGQDKTV